MKQTIVRRYNLVTNDFNSLWVLNPRNYSLELVFYAGKAPLLIQPFPPLH